MSLQDGDAYPGVLNVSERRVSFLPIVRDASSAIEPWQIALRKIRELEVGTMEGMLTIRTASEERSVMGTEVQEILEAIEGALPEPA